MRNSKDFLERVAQYAGINAYSVLMKDYGNLAWQVGTGENVEIMFIETRESRQGYGKRLLREMVNRIKPFNSVYVFRLASNENAGHFYRSLGFKETRIKGLYKEDAVLGVVNYETLCQNLSKV